MYRKRGFLFSFFLFLFILWPAAVSADTCYAPFDYRQSEARQMLSIVNEHRAANGAETLQYDYYL